MQRSDETVVRGYSSFRSIIRVGPYRASRAHGHATWELALYSAGDGWATIGRERVRIAPGTIVCYPPDVPHAEHGDAAFTGWFVHCAGAPWRPAPVPTGRDGADGIVARVLALMHEQALRGGDGHAARLQAWHDLLLAHLRVAVGATTAAHPAVERLRAAIAERFRDPAFTVESAMRPLGLAPDHLRRSFARALGATPRRWLIDLRIAYAKDLLAAGAGVAEAAAAVGFADPYYFSRAFLAATGARPSAWAGAAAAARSAPTKPG